MIVDRGRRLTRKFRDHWKEKIREAGVHCINFHILLFLTLIQFMHEYPIYPP